MANLMTAVSQRARAEAADYAAGDNRPLGGYLTVMGVYAAVAGAGALAVRRRGLPERIRLDDVALLALATHKASRLLSKDAVTSPLRAPFTRYTGTSGPNELREEVRHDGGIRHAVGELVTCPFCLSQWIATGFGLGLVLRPRLTRLVAAVLAIRAGSDALQLGYAYAQQRAQATPR